MGLQEVIMRSWTIDWLVEVHIRILMYVVTDILKLKTDFSYLWFSGLGISKTILNYFSS